APTPRQATPIAPRKTPRRVARPPCCDAIFSAPFCIPQSSFPWPRAAGSLNNHLIARRPRPREHSACRRPRNARRGWKGQRKPLQYTRREKSERLSFQIIRRPTHHLGGGHLARKAQGQFPHEDRITRPAAADD